MSTKSFYYYFVKRTLDIILSLFALLILSPVIIITSLIILKKIGAPVMFKQERPGKDDKIFLMYKFRTMSDKKDINGDQLPDKERLTKLGKVLRSTSLDELPELFNILKGDMSIVGPRPLLVEYLPLYNKEQKKRHLVRPGLTGLAQINGRNSINWEERFKLDVEYVNNISFKNDCKIFFLTIKKVFRREGITAEGSCTMEKFEGNDDNAARIKNELFQ